jgi:hypothetical protein
MQLWANYSLGASGDRFGAAVAVGRYTSSTLRQVVVGAPSRRSTRGAVYLLPLSCTSSSCALGTTQEVRQTVAFPTDDIGSYFGSTLTNGDVNSDGTDDLLVGVPNRDNVTTDDGVVVWIQGATLASPSALAAAFFAQPTTHGGVTSYEQFGTAIAVGDFNHDGVNDVAVGTPGKNPNGVGWAGTMWLMRSAHSSGPSWPTDLFKFADYLDPTVALQR